MTLKVKKDIDIYLVAFTFLEMLVLRWILIGQDTIKLLFETILVGRLIYIHHKKTTASRQMVMLAFLMLAYIFLRTLVNVEVNCDTFLNNSKYFVESIIIFVYIGYIYSVKSDSVEELFFSLRPFLNIYYFVNIVIILLQYKRKFFLMPAGKITNSYYPDHLAGLLGIEGTHRLALFTIFVLLLNILFLSTIPFKSFRFVWILAECVLIVVTAFLISTINDNNMVYLLIPGFLFLYYAVDSKPKPGRWIGIIVLGVIVMIIVGFVLTGDMFRNYLGGRIGSALTKVFDIFIYGQTGDERLTHLIYAFSNCDGVAFGKGFDAICVHRDPSITELGYVYRNWGMSDIAPMIAFGGIWFYLGSVMATAKILVSKERGFLLYWGCVASLLVLSYYHQIYTSWTMAIPACWIAGILRMGSKRIRQEKVIDEKG